MKTASVTLDLTPTSLYDRLVTAGVPVSEIQDMISSLNNSQVDLYTANDFTVRGVNSTLSATFPGGVYNVAENASSLMSTLFSGSAPMSILIV